MDRNELERMDREGLVLRAQAAGVRRARLLTRPELIDELLRLDPVVDESQLKRTRGFFGIARDLLSKVVERGLHLPDAADRLRTALGNAPPNVPRPEPQAVPTVTLAEIYAAQGHKQRAVETLRRVLDAEPDHGAARALLEKLEAADYIGPPPALPPEPEVEDMSPPADDGATEEEAFGVLASEGSVDPDAPTEANAKTAALRLAAAELERSPQRWAPNDDPGVPEEPSSVDDTAATVALGSDSVKLPASSSDIREPAPVAVAAAAVEVEVDEHGDDREPFVAECVAVPLVGGRSYVWWRIPAELGTLGGDATFVVRTLVLVPTWDGPEQRTIDIPTDPRTGEMVLRDLPPRAIVRVAIGWVDPRGGGELVPIAHSPALEMTSSQELVRWTLAGMEPVHTTNAEPSILRAIAAAERVHMLGAP